MTNLICFGDSITAGANVPDGFRWPVILQGLLEAWRPGEFRVYNRGVGSNTALQGFDRLATDVLPMLPGLVLIQFGYNDATVYPHAQVPRVGREEFMAKLREMHRITCAQGGQAAFIINHPERSPSPQGNGRTYQENYRPYEEAIRQVAQELGAPAIDLPRMMQERGTDLEAFLAEDGIHLTEAGNREYAEMVLTALARML